MIPFQTNLNSQQSDRWTLELGLMADTVTKARSQNARSGTPLKRRTGLTSGKRSPRKKPMQSEDFPHTFYFVGLIPIARNDYSGYEALKPLP